MKKKGIIGIIAGVALLSTVVAGLVFWKGQTHSYATVRDNLVVSNRPGADGKPYYMKKTNTKKPIGSMENPLTILEIVPTRCQAQIGYMIKGCEPIDMDAAVNDNAAVYDLVSHLASTNLPEERRPYEFYLNGESNVVFGDQVPQNSKVYFGTADTEINKGNLPDTCQIVTKEEADADTSVYRWQNQQATQTGYYQKVTDKTGNFVLKSNAGEQSPDENNATFVYKEGKGDYNWVKAENTENIPTDYTADQVWTTRTEPVRYIQNKKYLNKDKLIQQIYGKTSDEMAIQVVTLECQEVSEDIINEADLIYIHAGKQGGQPMPEIWKKYHKVEFEKNETPCLDYASTQSVEYRFSKNDISWNTMWAIVKRMAGKNPAAIILENVTMMEGQNTGNLCYALLQFAPRVFYETFGEEIEKNLSKYQNMKWNQDTFYDSQNEMHRQLVQLPHALPIEHYDIRDKVMAFNGDETLWQLGMDPVIEEQDDQQNFTSTSPAFDYFEEKRQERPTHITGNDAIEYILRGTGDSEEPEEPEKNKKGHLKILEIEPCGTFVYKNENYPWKLYYSSLLQGFEGSGKGGSIDWEKDIEVRTMASYEFVGNLDDLNAEYDMILFGPMRDASNGGNGGTNDPSMASYYYTKSGDTVSRSSNLRYTGNDITQKKLHELVSFMRAGKPIVIDSTYFTKTEKTKADFESFSQDAPNVDTYKAYQIQQYKERTDEEKKNHIPSQVLESKYRIMQVDTSKIEPGSNIEAFMREYFHADAESEDCKFFINNAFLNRDDLEKALLEEQCKLVIDSAPISYGYTKSNGTRNDENEQGETAEDQTIKEMDYANNLDYTIKIIGPEGARYHLNLYGDTDSDGIYTGSLKEQMELTDNGKPEAADTENISTDDFEQVFEANKTYTVSRPLSSSYRGMLPWKLEANRINADGTDNKDIRDSEIGYAAVKPKTDITIRVLQMNPNLQMQGQGIGGNGNIDYTGVTFDEVYAHISKESNPDLVERLVREDNKHRSEAQIIQDYNAKMDALRKDSERTLELFNLYKDVPGYDITVEFLKNDEWMEKFGKTNDEAGWINYLKKYDMIIFGYMDQALYTDNQTFHNGVMDFIDRGKSVIFSHDMVRDDTFKGAEFPDKELSAFEDTLREVCGQNKSTDNREDNATRLFRRNFTRGSYADRSNAEGNPPPFVTNGNESGTVNYTTNYVGIVNRSQLTEYPYDIPDVIKTSTTHGQNRQLNFEQRDQGDVAVWFNLTDHQSVRYSAELDKLNAPLTIYDGWNGEVANSSGNSGKTAQEKRINNYIYSSREGDSGSNFYIYNTGNVTYTGVGHQNDVTEKEMQLFINTMIAAYRINPDPPTVDVTNPDIVTNENNVTLYITTDDQIDETGFSLPINLKVNDTSIAKYDAYRMLIEEKIGENTYAEYTQKEGSSHPLQKGKKDVPDAAFITGAREAEPTLQPDEQGYIAVEKNGEYYFEVPYAEVKEMGEKQFRVTLLSHYKDVNEKEYEDSSVTNITVLQVGLYDLN
ncbi:MAG: DUF5057 domain-containing protein [Lachnospiraceae bacterium]